MFHTHKTKIFWITSFITLTAGFMYNSWPLGYLLNPVVSKHGLASELEALHQPYNWLFIFLDVMSGVLVSVAAALLWRHAKGKLHKIVLVNFALFGIFTTIDALMPMKCDPSIAACPSLSHQPLLVLHGIASITASVCLFVSAMLVWWQKRHNKTGSAVMSTLMAGWALFGVFSVYFFFVPGPGYLAQHYYITLCSVWIMLLPFMLGQDKKAFAR